MAVGFDKFDEEKERERLRKMSDEQLIREGKAARYMCAPSTNFGKPPRDVYVIALRLCKEEYRRRHPKQSVANAQGVNSTKG
ncbi:MAG: hypothetical protein WBQ04_03735 [Candidatus Acidiferrales bacterium]